jgi:hypothetical protein
MVAHAPTDDLARVQVHDGGHIEPAFAGGDVSQILSANSGDPSAWG